MTAPAPKRLLWLLAPVAAFAATLALLTAVQGGGGAAAPAMFDRPGPASVDVPPARRPPRRSPRRARRSRRSRATRRSTPRSATSTTSAGARPRTATWNEKAHDAYRRALELDPQSAQATTGLGTLALAKHDFAGGLRYGEQALRTRARIGPSLRRDRRRPGRARPLRAAARARSTGWSRSSRTSPPTRASPTSASFTATWTARSRRCGARCPPEAARPRTSPTSRRCSATSSSRPATSRVPSEAYRTALARVPEYLPAQAGLATVQAAQGDLDGAIAATRAVVRTSAVHEYHLLLLEAKLAAGRYDAARCGDRGDPREPGDRAQRNGVNTDAELAIFEADHGSAARAVELGRSAVRKAPSVSSADAYSWALTSGRPRRRQALHWAKQALRTGWRDPLVRYHAGMAAKLAGERHARAPVAHPGARAEPAVLAAARPARAARARLARLDECDGVATADARGEQPQQAAKEHLGEAVLDPDPEVGAGRTADAHRGSQPPHRRDVRPIAE